MKEPSSHTKIAVKIPSDPRRSDKVAALLMNSVMTRKPKWQILRQITLLQFLVMNNE